MSVAPDRALARDLLRELIRIDTRTFGGSTTPAAELVARRLREAGVPGDDVHVLGPHPAKGNLVARLRGSGARPPLLLLAHLDVVDADPAEWATDPFSLVERDGHFHGRGTLDDKAMAALWTAIVLQLRAEGRVLDRDVILALTADEEGGDQNGAQWLLAEHRALVEAGYGFNEGGYGRIQGGRRISNQVQASEKVGVFVELEARGRGGHSSLPDPDNPILRLVAAIDRIARHRFPIRLNEVTRGFFARMAELDGGPLAADMRAAATLPADPDALARLAAVPYFEGLLRTTCAPTRFDAGTGNNVLPQAARAVLDCRILPDDSPDEVLRRLADVIADDGVTVRPLNPPRHAPASPLLREVMDPVERITESIWPGVPVVPVMTIGATDSLHFRAAGIPMFGVSGLFLDMDDVRAHAPDERISIEAFERSHDFLLRLVRAVSGEGVER